MKQGCCMHLSAHAGVHFFNELLSKTGRALSTSAARKRTELSHGEVAGEHRHDVEKPGLGLGIAKLLDALKVSSWNLHSAKLLFVRSTSFGACPLGLRSA